jgi:hypothetical protein
MEFVLNAVVMMMLVAFPVGLFLGTLDLYSNRWSSGAIRHPQPASRSNLALAKAA